MTEVLIFLAGTALTLLLIALIRRVTGFAAQRPADYADATPALDLRHALDGDIRCDGVIYGPTGRVTSRFHGAFHAVWAGDTLTMRERFDYDSGTVQHREWRITLAPDGTMTAHADDVVGTGTGHQTGNAVNLRYRLRLPAEAGGHRVDVDDWMYLTPGGALVNRSQFRMWGIKVAELIATMHRVPSPTPPVPANTKGAPE